MAIIVAQVLRNLILISFCVVVGALLGSALIGLAVGLGIALLAQVVV